MCASVGEHCSCRLPHTQCPCFGAFICGVSLPGSRSLIQEDKGLCPHTCCRCPGLLTLSKIPSCSKIELSRSQTVCVGQKSFRKFFRFGNRSVDPYQLCISSSLKPTNLPIYPVWSMLEDVRLQVFGLRVLCL